MKRICLYGFMLLTSLFCFAACNDDDKDDDSSNDNSNNNNNGNNGVTITSAEVTFVDGVPTIDYSVSVVNGFEIIDCGICYSPASESSDPTIDNSNIIGMYDDASTKNYQSETACDITVKMTNISSGTWKYRVLARVDNSEEITYYYGPTITFTVSGSGSGYTLTMNSTEEMGSDYAMCRAQIDITNHSQSEFEGATCGFCWCLESEGVPTINNNKLDCTASAFANNGAFEGRLEGLLTNTTYHVCAYLTKDGITTYGDWSQFTTEENNGNNDPDGISINSQNVESSSASFSVVATVNSEELPTAAGICYATTSNPTTSDNIVDCFAAAQAGDGTFTATITGLTPQTTYYVKAYMILNGSTVYSEEKTFTTSVSK